MIRSELMVTIEGKVEEVWNVITDNDNYQWRSDLDRIEKIEEDVFVEYTKNNFPTRFKITKKDTTARYEFDIENVNLTGHFTAMLKAISDTETKLTLIEEIEVNHFFMKLFAKKYLQKQQQRYVEDLQKELNAKNR